MNDIRYPVPYGTMREWMKGDDDGIAKWVHARGKKRRTELPCFSSLAESKAVRRGQQGDCSRREARDEVAFWTRHSDAVVGAEAALDAALGDLSQLQVGQLEGIVLSRTGHVPPAKTGKGDALLAEATAAVSEQAAPRQPRLSAAGALSIIGGDGEVQGHGRRQEDRCNA